MEVMDEGAEAARKRRELVGRGTVRIAAVLWTVLILFLLLAPLPEVPGAPGNLDRVVHFLLFGVETVLLYAAQAGIRASPPRRLLVALIGAAVLAVGTEAAQGLLPYRSLEFSDLGMDFLGLLSASLPVYLGYSFRRRKNRHESGRSQASH